MRKLISVLFVLFMCLSACSTADNLGVSLERANGQGEVGIILEAGDFQVPVELVFGVEMVESIPCTVVRVSVAGFTAKGTANTEDEVCVKTFGVVSKIRLTQAPQVDQAKPEEPSEESAEFPLLLVAPMR